MEERAVGIQTLVSHYKYPCHHKVSTRDENRNIFCFCFTKLKEENCLMSGFLHVAVYIVLDFFSPTLFLAY